MNGGQAKLDELVKSLILAAEVTEGLEKSLYSYIICSVFSVCSVAYFAFLRMRQAYRMKKKSRPISQMRRLGKHVLIRNPYILKVSFAIKRLHKATQF